VTVSDRDVMLLFDGELDPERARAIRAQSVHDPSIDARLLALAQLSAFTRGWARTHGPARSTREPRRALERSHARTRKLGMAAIFVSLGVAVLVPGPPGEAAMGGVAGSRAPATTVVPAVAIENVDFGAHSGTIFSVRGAGTDTTVVWLSDDADGALSAAL